MIPNPSYATSQRRLLRGDGRRIRLYTCRDEAKNEWTVWADAEGKQTAEPMDGGPPLEQAVGKVGTIIMFDQVSELGLAASKTTR